MASSRGRDVAGADTTRLNALIPPLQHKSWRQAVDYPKGGRPASAIADERAVEAPKKELHTQERDQKTMLPAAAAALSLGSACAGDGQGPAGGYATRATSFRVCMRAPQPRGAGGTERSGTTRYGPLQSGARGCLPPNEPGRQQLTPPQDRGKGPALLPAFSFRTGALSSLKPFSLFSLKLGHAVSVWLPCCAILPPRLPVRHGEPVSARLALLSVSTSRLRPRGRPFTRSGGHCAPMPNEEPTACPACRPNRADRLARRCNAQGTEQAAASCGG